MHEDLLKQQHLEEMRQLGNIQTPGMGAIQTPGIGNARARYPVGVAREAGIPRSASLANMQDPHRPLEPGEWRDCNTPAVPVDLSPLHGPNYRNLPAYLEGRDRVIIAEICEHLGIRYSRAEAVRIGRELRARAWRPSLWRVDGKIVSGFHRPGALRPRQVVKPAAPPAVGFWRRLANLLTGGDR